MRRWSKLDRVEAGGKRRKRGSVERGRAYHSGAQTWWLLMCFCPFVGKQRGEGLSRNGRRRQCWGRVKVAGWGKDDNQSQTRREGRVARFVWILTRGRGGFLPLSCTTLSRWQSLGSLCSCSGVLRHGQPENVWLCCGRKAVWPCCGYAPQRRGCATGSQGATCMIQANK